MSPPLPTPETLARYGLSAGEWLDLAGDACPICERPWSDSVRPVVDHAHVRGWKAMPPEERRLYVRGVICRGCNHFVLTRHVTPLKLANGAKYLLDYERRRDEEASTAPPVRRVSGRACAHGHPGGQS